MVSWRKATQGIDNGKKSLKASCLLDLVHSDLCGLMPIQVIDATMHFMTFIDDIPNEFGFISSKGN
jgi:hypothetical protein